MTRGIAAILLLLVLPGCGAATGVAALGKATEVLEIRIARQTEYNNARLDGYLAIADELRRKIVEAIDDEEFDALDRLMPHYETIMEKARPALLIEEARRIRDGPQE
ncbi:MAG: hypothetical protein ACR2PW_04570 [Gammaproteobacteria bacterium]